MVSPERSGNQIKMVCELLEEGSKEWDIELVRRLFLPQDVEAILSTPISMFRLLLIEWFGLKIRNEDLP